MRIDEIRALIGAHGGLYSTEVARSDVGIAWHNGQARFGEEHWDGTQWTGGISFDWTETPLDTAKGYLQVNLRGR